MPEKPAQIQNREVQGQQEEREAISGVPQNFVQTAAACLEKISQLEVNIIVMSGRIWLQTQLF